jgi:hypothetical protein
VSGGTANYNLIVDGSSNLGQEQYLGAARFPALTGDVTTTAGSLATAIGAGKVTNAMLAGSITAANLVGTDIATVGTITAGTWHGTVISGLYGGTGTNNGSNTITLGNNLTTSGNFALTLTQTGTTNVTLPTTGTLLTTTGSGGSLTFPGTLSVASGKTLTASNTLTFTGTDSSSVAFGAGGTVVYNGRLINTTSPITGGGDLSADRTIACATCATTTNGGALSGTSPVAVSAAGAISLTPTTGSLGNVVYSTSPTLTTPVIAQINDTNGNAYLKSTATASAVDQLTITNAATGGHTVDIAGTGTDTNISLSFTPKGSGQSTFITTGTVPVTVASTGTSGSYIQFLTGTNTSKGYLGYNSTDNGLVFLSASGGGVNWGWNDGGLFTRYGTIATLGRGIPAIYAAVASTGQTASIAATNLQCGAAVCAAGLYRVHVYTVVTTTGTGTLTTTIGWTDPGQAQTITSGGIATTAKNFEQLDYVIRADGVANITYATTLSVSGTYAIYVTLERLE